MTQAKLRMMPARRSGLSSHPVYTGPQASAATFAQGAPVKLTSGNLAAMSLTAKSSLSMMKASSAAGMIGISNGLAVASSTGNIVVSKITPGMQFVGNLIHATASSAKVSKVGSTVYLGKVTAETHYGWSLTAPSSTSTVKGIVVDLVDPASTVNGRVLVEVTYGGQFS
jgi:hypothetical protein